MWGTVPHTQAMELLSMFRFAFHHPPTLASLLGFGGEQGCLLLEWDPAGGRPVQWGTAGAGGSEGANGYRKNTPGRGALGAIRSESGLP